MGTKSEDEEFTEQLIERAMSGKHTEIELISSFPQMCQLCELLDMYYDFMGHFNRSTRRIRKLYINSLKSGMYQPNMLAATVITKRVAKFYEEEASRIDYMISEYKHYLFLGHCADIFTCAERDENFMYDHLGGYKSEVADNIDNDDQEDPFNE